ncbi:hypothetical protein GCM10019016_076480 [Streptomyces prasinosporus]|uniref:Uncharacterized protein n=1 Tax=Streptomyces prasinosporus TaxID=68256 RepID=A0ABP6TYS8_9ACTN
MVRVRGVWPCGNPRRGRGSTRTGGLAARRAGVAAGEGVGVGEQDVRLRDDPDALAGVPGEFGHRGREPVPGAVGESVRAQCAGDPGDLLAAGRDGLLNLTVGLTQRQPGGGGGGGQRHQHEQTEDTEPEAHRASFPCSAYFKRTSSARKYRNGLFLFI